MNSNKYEQAQTLSRLPRAKMEGMTTAIMTTMRNATPLAMPIALQKGETTDQINNNNRPWTKRKEGKVLLTDRRKIASHLIGCCTSPRGGSFEAQRQACGQRPQGREAASADKQNASADAACPVLVVLVWVALCV